MKEEEFAEVKLKVAMVLIPIVIILAIFFYYQSNSISHTKKEYLKLLNEEYIGTIKEKKQYGDYPRATRKVILENNSQVYVDFDEYARLSVGDKVLKEKGKDTLYFYLKDGKQLSKDYTKFQRENYLENKADKSAFQ